MPKGKGVGDLERKAVMRVLETPDQMMQNAAKMRGAGPDTPIDWTAYATAPTPEVEPQSVASRLLERFASKASAETEGAVKAGKNFLSRFGGNGSKKGR